MIEGRGEDETGLTGEGEGEKMGEQHEQERDEKKKHHTNNGRILLLLLLLRAGVWERAKWR